MSRNRQPDWLRQENLSRQQMLKWIIRLSIPAVLAKLSSTVMQYIDAMMVGSLGAEAAASIGLVASSTWLTGSLCLSAGMGFSIMVAHAVGAGKRRKAGIIVLHGLVTVVLFSILVGIAGALCSNRLPLWLGGTADIYEDASLYFLVSALSLPVVGIRYAAAGMLQSGGNMRVPNIIDVLICLMDVVFNRLLIYSPTMAIVLGHEFIFPGAGLGVLGAALGTALAELLGMLVMLYALWNLFSLRNIPISLVDISAGVLKKAAVLSLPLGAESILMCGAQIAFTRIVSPLGSISLAANSLAITAESFCYMPCYGIAGAAAVMIGQSIGARREGLAKSVGWLSVGFGMLVMGCMGLLMYWLAPQMMEMFSPVEEVQILGTAVLRIEALAEPLFGASIVAAGVFRGAGRTSAPMVISFASMWGGRLPLALYLSADYGLAGVWWAMCIELSLRGIVFLLMLRMKFAGHKLILGEDKRK